MKIAIIGADGQLGTDVTRVLGNDNHEVVKLTINHIEVSDINSVSRVLAEVKPEMVINTAAYHHTEKCEDDPITSFQVNAMGPRNVATVCNDLNAAILQISTDYVFDGKKRAPYVETDLPMPLNVYANTKLAGEYYVEAIAKKWYTLRVSGIYGKAPCLGKGGMNFVDLMIKLSREREEVRVVDNEFLTPTPTLEIARQIAHLIEKKPENGLYHCTSEDSCSWYEFAGEIFEITKPDVKFNKAAPGEFAIKVNRPEYSVLENENLKKANLNIMRHWKEGLREYLGA